MSLVQLESFVVVAEEGHVGRAAKRLHISQPPLTRRIRTLEEELGVALFERTRRGMRLLPAGNALLGRARAILELVEDTRSSITRDRRSSSPDVDSAAVQHRHK
jgi:DNA-binding transcriptional LysR family regulator